MVGDLEPARRCMEKAIKLNPNDYVVMLYAAQVLAYTNDVDEGLRWLEKQVRHDPRSIDARARLSLRSTIWRGDTTMPPTA